MNKIKHAAARVLLPGKPFYAICGKKDVPVDQVVSENWRELTCVECAHQ